jgi:hypothetical protein
VGTQKKYLLAKSEKRALSSVCVLSGEPVTIFYAFILYIRSLHKRRALEIDSEKEQPELRRTFSFTTEYYIILVDQPNLM